MRITFVSPLAGLSGGTRVIAIHADRLAARGHDVTVVAPRARAPGIKSQLKTLGRGRMPRALDDRSHFDAMRAATYRRIDHDGPVGDDDVPDADAVIATWWETAFAVTHLAPSKGRKLYFVQHHEDFDFLPSHISRGSYYLPLKKLTISGWLERLMAEEYGDTDVPVIPNSVDASQFFAPPRRRRESPTVGLMYAAAGFKGVDVANRAIAQARLAHPDLKVIAFGLDRVTKDLPLPEGAEFFFRPAQDRLREIYARCDVWLVASRSEGFGLPVVEAMACRCPVVATRTGCAPDLIEDGRNGFVVDVDDAEALGARLTELLAAPEPRWRAMSDAALAAVSGYSWDDATERFERALLAAVRDDAPGGT